MKILKFINNGRLAIRAAVVYTHQYTQYWDIPPLLIHLTVCVSLKYNITYITYSIICYIYYKILSTKYEASFNKHSTDALLKTSAKVNTAHNIEAQSLYVFVKVQICLKD